ncbi:hypothetical protein LOK49_LG09G00443 [Camellia lanceoleosa]|uniref:Uncharacterized protein n=1 Tax=Camellia lanceoleosa TaxID=1840588 RepID=A0ACC0GKS7_9ERIC|nr:hypothetical protein LOK49_LG09G00443 [Camellia lanceoleosa]
MKVVRRREMKRRVVLVRFEGVGEEEWSVLKESRAVVGMGGSSSSTSSTWVGIGMGLMIKIRLSLMGLEI